MDEISSEAVIGIAVVGGLVLLTCISVLCYWLKKKRVGSTKQLGNGTQMSEYANQERAPTPPINATRNAKNGYRLKLQTESTNHSIFMNDTQGQEGAQNP